MRLAKLELKLGFIGVIPKHLNYQGSLLYLKIDNMKYRCRQGSILHSNRYQHDQLSEQVYQMRKFALQSGAVNMTTKPPGVNQPNKQ